jgi:hypothetical protein
MFCMVGGGVVVLPAERRARQRACEAGTLMVWLSLLAERQALHPKDAEGREASGR